MIDNEKIDIKDEVNSIALSWGVGGGIEYSVGPKTALVGGIYYQNFITDVTKDNGLRRNDGEDNTVAGSVKEDTKSILQGLTIRLGVLF